MDARAGAAGDGEREEVRALARLHPALRGRQHHRVAGTDDDGAVGLFRELSGLERDLAAADLDRDPGATFSGNSHVFPPLSFVRGWRFESALGWSTRSNFHPL